mmetsp:Transcript_83927/g.271185  ORF Transcript_83927/g.271185 Transcript_83927/m.271185 type:complete len:133 (-) Transcript_83927:277-675(-)
MQEVAVTPPTSKSLPMVECPLFMEGRDESLLTSSPRVFVRSTVRPIMVPVSPIELTVESLRAKLLEAAERCSFAAGPEGCQESEVFEWCSSTGCVIKEDDIEGCSTATEPARESVGEGSQPGRHPVRDTKPM